VLYPSCCAPRHAPTPAAVRAPSCSALRRVPARFLHRWRHETNNKTILKQVKRGLSTYNPTGKLCEEN
jgi:hypothetical protein